MNSDTIIAERIKQKRTELKMTQRDLAKAAQTTPATISAYEKALKKPSIDNMMKIAEVFNVSIDWLCGKENIKEVQTLKDIVLDFFEIDKYFKITDCNKTGTKLNFSFISNEAMNDFFSSWLKMKMLCQNKLIDNEVFDLWVEKELKKSAQISIIPYKENK